MANYQSMAAAAAALISGLLFIIATQTCYALEDVDNAKANLLLQRSLIRAKLGVNPYLIRRRKELYKKYVDADIISEEKTEDKTRLPIADFLKDGEDKLGNKAVDAGSTDGAKQNSDNKLQVLNSRSSILDVLKYGENDLGNKVNSLNKTRRLGIPDGHLSSPVKEVNSPRARDILPGIYHEDAYHELPVPLSNSNPFMHLKTHSTSPYFGTDGDPFHGGVAAHSNDVQSEALLGGIGGSAPCCHFSQTSNELPTKITNADEDQMLSQANSMKQNSQLLAMQASQLEHQAMTMKEPGVTGHNEHLSHDYVNVDKPVHIMSGHEGQGPERGGSVGLEHNALNYKVNVGDRISVNPPRKEEALVKEVDTGFPVYNLPTKPVNHAKFTDFVRPLPPIGGPNPYEVLTSASLGKDYPGIELNRVPGSEAASAVGGQMPTRKNMKFVVSLVKNLYSRGKADKRSVNKAKKSNKTKRRHRRKHRKSKRKHRSKKRK